MKGAAMGAAKAWTMGTTKGGTIGAPAGGIPMGAPVATDMEEDKHKRMCESEMITYGPLTEGDLGSYHLVYGKVLLLSESCVHGRGCRNLIVSERF